jgi:hypothetical protein
MPPKDSGKDKDAGEKSISASRLAAMNWKPTPFTHLSFIRGFEPFVCKVISHKRGDRPLAFPFFPFIHAVH